MNWIKGWFDPPRHSDFDECWKRLPVVIIVKILQFTNIQTTYKLFYTSKAIYRYGCFLHKQINEYKRLSNAHRFMYFMYQHKHRCLAVIHINNSYICTNFMRFKSPGHSHCVVFYNIPDDKIHAIFGFNDCFSVFGFKKKYSNDIKKSFIVIGMTWCNINTHIIRINITGI